MHGCQTVGFSQTGVAAEDVGAAVFPAEDSPLGKYGQSVEGGRTGRADHRICQHLIIKGNIDAVMVAVKGHGLHLDGGIEKLGAAHLCVGGGIQQLLGTGGQVYTQIFDAVLIPTGIGDFPGVNGHSLAQIVGIAAQGIPAFVKHGNPSC